MNHLGLQSCLIQARASRPGHAVRTEHREHRQDRIRILGVPASWMLCADTSFSSSLHRNLLSRVPHPGYSVHFQRTGYSRSEAVAVLTAPCFMHSLLSPEDLPSKVTDPGDVSDRY